MVRNGGRKAKKFMAKKFVVRDAKHPQVVSHVCITTLQISCEMARVANMKGMIVFCIMDAGTW